MTEIYFLRHCNSVDDKILSENNSLRKFLFSCSIFCLLLNVFCSAQIPNLPTIENPNPNTHSVFGNYSEIVTSGNKNKSIAPSFSAPQNNSDAERLRLNNEKIRKEVEQNQKITYEENKRKLEERELEEAEKRNNDLYNFPSLSDKAGVKSYYDAFDKLSSLDTEKYSVGKANFIVENAFYDNKKSYEGFHSQIKETVKSLKLKMKQLKFDTLSNASKNLMLFKFFSENMTLKGKSHKAVKYDFEDFWGKKDWSKMFVNKLMEKGSGNCHSMPLYYLSLAEELGAEAYLAFAPNHFYIRFTDEDKEWLDLELTNGMFTANSLILESGYVKSEALNNKIYMENLDKKKLLSQFYTDLANGYIHKYGYDNFVFKTINKALELYPDNIFANMIRGNYDMERFNVAMKNLGIDVKNENDVKKIGYLPKAVFLSNMANARIGKIDNLGYEPMSEEAYASWLGNMKNENNKQKSKEIAERMEKINAEKMKEKKEQLKKAPPVKNDDKSKTKLIPKELL